MASLRIWIWKIYESDISSVYSKRWMESNHTQLLILIRIHTYIHNWSLQPFSQDYWLSRESTRTFYFKNVRQFVPVCLGLYKCKTKQTTSSKNSVSLVWSCVACEENSHGLKIAVVMIYRKVVSAYGNRSVKKYSEQKNCCCIIKSKQWRII